MQPDPAFAERLRDEARRIDTVFSEAAHLRPERLKQLSLLRRALAAAIPLFGPDEFPDEGI